MRSFIDINFFQVNLSSSDLKGTEKNVLITLFFSPPASHPFDGITQAI